MVIAYNPYSAWKVRQFVRLFESGGVFAYPTESVYGLGCDPMNREAVERILEIKRRDPAKGMILIASDFQQLEPWIALRRPTDRKKLAAPQKRPTTWLVPAAEDVPWWIRGNHNCIAVRLTRFPPVVQLCESVHSALVSTSANFAGHPPQKKAVPVVKLLGNQLDVMIYGETGGVAQPSEIRDFYSGEVIRAG